MAEGFVPVDLNKLLDDFEEQDSATATSPVHLHQSSFQPKAITKLNGFSPNTCNDTTPFTNYTHRPQVNMFDHKVISSDCLPTKKHVGVDGANEIEERGDSNHLSTNGDTKVTPDIEQSFSQVRGMEPKGVNSYPLSANQMSTAAVHGCQSVVPERIDSNDLTTNQSARFLAQHNQQPFPEKSEIDTIASISLSENKSASSTGYNQLELSDIPRENSPSDLSIGESAPSPSLALPTHCSSQMNQADQEEVDLNGLLSQGMPMLDPKVYHNGFGDLIQTSPCITSVGHSSSNVVVCSTDVSTGGINTDSCSGAFKSDIQIKEQLCPEPTQGMDLSNCFLNGQNEVCIEEPRKENNNQEGTTVDGGSTLLVDEVFVEGVPGAEKSEQISNIVTSCGEVTCVDRTSSEPTNSYEAPPTAGDTSSLFFIQDHFANLHVEEASRTLSGGTDSTPQQVAPISATNNEASGRNDEPGSQQVTDGHFIPVAQDAVADVFSPLRCSDDLLTLEGSFQLGYSPPQWIPDSEANRCTNCNCKFTVVRRRHHCRACGKIFCSSCCNLKFNLHYLEDRLARVCQTCANALLQRQATLGTHDEPVSSGDESAMYMYMNPAEHEGAGTFITEPGHVSTVNNETTPVGDEPLVYEDEQGVDLSTPHEVTSVPELPENAAATDESSQIGQFRSITCSSSSSLSSADIPVTSTVPLPPLLRKTDEGLNIDSTPNHQEILYLLKKKKETVTFLLNKNLIVRVKIVKLNCCVKRKCWCFSSEGMGAADQEDMVILLECLPKESCIPQDVLSHFNTAFAYAKQGHRVTDLGYTIFGQPFLGSLRNAGFLYIKSSFQCLANLILPSGPHIFGILIQREEVSWVQLFPIRLILRLGAEYRYYPCPLWSVRDRQALYGEVGHTIMDLLADFKNFQYTLPRVTGMHVHVEDKRTVIQLPQNRYDEVVKVLNSTDEYVMAFEATFSNVADSHLVCIQEGSGYKTQAINIEGHERKVTGASFVVFNGALKTTTDMKAKVSIVEDGVMVQMVMQLSQEMRQAMREMRDFTISTGSGSDAGSVQEVIIEWVTKRAPSSESILSPIDGLALGTTTDIRINTHFDYSTRSVYRLRWSQLFFLNHTEQRPRNLSPHFKQTTADIAKACTVALRPYLASLSETGKSRIGLRVNLSPDMVGYTIGSQGTGLPDEMTNNLDNELVPAINSAVNPSNSAPTSMEFVFNITEMLS